MRPDREAAFWKTGGKTMKRKALLVGINDYSPAGPGGPDLNGCVNDVRDVAHTLSALGIIPATKPAMHILTDQRATRANILAELKWLVSGASRGDVLVFYYSGHGSQVADVSGDETDRKDETICPCDFSTAGMIKDDDIRAAIAGVPSTANLDVILDSCHSGTGTRAAMMGAPEGFTIRYVEPPLDEGFFVEANSALPLRGILKPEIDGEGRRELKPVPGLNHVLWAACRDYQTSAEAPVDGVVRGLFTYAFCKCLRNAGVGITRAQLDAKIGAYLASIGAAQVPQTEGTRTSFGEKVFT
jgi:metacaspase-1